MSIDIDAPVLWTGFLAGEYRERRVLEVRRDLRQIILRLIDVFGQPDRDNLSRVADLLVKRLDEAKHRAVPLFSLDEHVDRWLILAQLGVVDVLLLRFS